MPLILHIVDRPRWQAAQTAGVYRHGLDTDGFIHCSNPEQVVWVANTFFSGQQDLVLLEIDSERLQSELRYDAVGEQTFPHVYGEINLDAVQRVLDFAPNADGEFELPPELQANR